MDNVLLIGSNNKDKAREIRMLLADSPWDVKSLSDFAPVREPVETEKSFEGNALLKARYYAERFGVACVADDTGLEVDALDGAPGVYSARYAGEDCSYDDNNRKLLAALEGLPRERRRACFVSVAAFVDGEGGEHVERGTVEGVIAPECLGEQGFGYDPVFIPDGFDCTFSELAPEAKAEVSHRGRAFRKLCDYLASLV